MIKFYLLLFLMLITPSKLAIAGETPELIQSSQTVSRLHQKSRNSAVKVRGINGSHGSGTYIKIGNRYGVLTARHVIESDTLFIVEGEGDSAVGRVVYSSEKNDIALIEIAGLRNASPINIGDIEIFDYEFGETVIYSGYPSSYDKLTSTGIVSGYERSENAVICQEFAWPGSSGSGVFNEGGDLVGVLYAVGVETFYVPEIIETLVYVVPLDRLEIVSIRRALEENRE